MAIRSAVPKVWCDVSDFSECEGCSGRDATVAPVAGRYFCAACSPASELDVRWKHVRSLRADIRELNTTIDALLEGESTKAGGE